MPDDDTFPACRDRPRPLGGFRVSGSSFAPVQIGDLSVGLARKAAEAAFSGNPIPLNSHNFIQARRPFGCYFEVLRKYIVVHGDRAHDTADAGPPDAQLAPPRADAVTAMLRDMRALKKLFVLLTERPAVFPTAVGNLVLPLAIGTLQALEHIAVPGTTTKQIKRALRHYIEGMAYLLASGLSGAQRHTLSGTPVEPVSQAYLLDFRKRFKQRRDTIREARCQLLVGTTPARSGAEGLAAPG